MATSSPWQMFKEEFRPVKFGLGHPDPDLFVRSEIQRPRWFYLLWRLFWFFWHLGWIIASGINTRRNIARYPEEGAKWFIYLTNTTLLLTTITTTVDFIIVFYVTVLRDGTVLGSSGKVLEENTVSSSDQGEQSEEIVFQGKFTLVDGLKQHTTTWYIKLMWLLYNIISSSNIIITILYWTVEYEGGTNVISIEVHIINTVFIILNILITAAPVQILHFIYPMAYVSLYILFNCIYIVSGGTDIKGRNVIYTVIDWSKPFPTAVVVTLGILVAIPLGHILVFVVYTLRVFIHSKINSKPDSAHGNCLRNSNGTVDVAGTSRREDNFEMTVSGSVA